MANCYFRLLLAACADCLYKQQPRPSDGGLDGTRGSYLGPEFGQSEIERRLRAAGATFSDVDDAAVIAQAADALIAQEGLGWF